MRAKDVIRLVISVAIVALFAYAYARNPSDDLLIGALISMVSTIVNWWFGSSQQSSDKNTTIQHMAMNEQATGKPDDPVHVTEDTQ
jgi:hypothetical protein